MKPNSPTTLPREFLGLARIRAVRLDDQVGMPMTKTILAVLKRRLRRKPTIRSEMCIELERIWQTMPSAWRIGELIVEHRSISHG
jgi:hypothetical protein